MTIYLADLLEGDGRASHLARVRITAGRQTRAGHGGRRGGLCEPPLSALPPDSDRTVHRDELTRCVTRRHVQCSNIMLLDDLIGAREQRRGNFEAERLGSLEIDGQVDLCGLMHRKVSRLLALENAVDVAGRASK
jgi:hypothetical protein